MRMTIGTRIYTWLRGELVGTDAAGNRYYRDKVFRPVAHGGGRESRERRWVIYAGAPDASKVPPEWHGWLHHTMDAPPKPGAGLKYPWQQAHQPNLSGSAGAYRPPGSVLRGGARERTTGDYEPWNPEAEEAGKP